ncbi:MAG: PAS domain S-box protein [Leptospiraceae bacterium]|nr:PAS domain S-box protein [Leptospiraceae bacterium]
MKSESDGGRKLAGTDQRRQAVLATVGVSAESLNRLLQSSLDLMTEGVNLVRDLDGSILYTNPAFDAMFGYASGELIGCTVSVLNADDTEVDHSVAETILAELKAAGRWSGELQNRRKDGSLFYTKARIHSFECSEIGPAWISFQTEITGRKKLQSAVAQAQQERRIAISLIPDMFFRINREGVYLDFKASDEELHVAPDFDFIGKRNRDFTPPEFADLIDARIAATLDSGEMQIFEYEMMTKGLGLQYFEARMLPSGADEVMAYVRNISERRQLQQRLDNERQYLQDLLDGMHAMVYVLADDYSITFANKYFKEIFGEPSGQTCYQLTRGQSAPCADCQTMQLYATPQKLAMDFQLANGRFYQMTAIPFQDLAGRSLILKMGIDITERKEAEEALQRSAADLRMANQSRERFMRIMAHDLRSPLASLVNGLEILQMKDSGLNDADRSQIQDHLLQSSRQTLELLNKLLDWSRLERGLLQIKPETVDLYAIIESSIIALFQQQSAHKGVHLLNKVDRQAQIEADPAMLETILRNLVSNALKFTGLGGTVTLESRQYESHMELLVTDTGVGIAAERIQTLFQIDKLYSLPGTNNESGSGLGLLLCQELVEIHQGRISVHSTVGQGSCFTVCLPRSFAAQVHQEK